MRPVMVFGVVIFLSLLSTTASQITQGNKED